MPGFSGTLSQKVDLNVFYPEASIYGGDDTLLPTSQYHVDQGSHISLTCIIPSGSLPTQYIFWYHNERMVNYDKERSVMVITKSEEKEKRRTESKLTVSKALKRDEGNYTCSPSNAEKAKFQIFVTASML
jgi:hypothetical protein